MSENKTASMLEFENQERRHREHRFIHDLVRHFQRNSEARPLKNEQLPEHEIDFLIPVGGSELPNILKAHSVALLEILLPEGVRLLSDGAVKRLANNLGFPLEFLDFVLDREATNNILEQEYEARRTIGSL